MEHVEIPEDFVRLAARDLRDPKDLAVQVLTNYTLERFWQEIQAEPEPPKISDK